MNIIKFHEKLNFKQAFDFLGITDKKQMLDYLFWSSIENQLWNKEQYIIQKKRNEWNDRFKIPKGISKTQLNKLQKETQNIINDLKEKINNTESEISKDFLNLIQDDWIAKKEKIKKQLKPHNDFGTENNLLKAKAFPIEQLLEFNNAGFAKCVNHEEKTPSMKLYKNRNKAHCFSCHGDFDSIDIKMKLENLTLNEAIKKLCLQ